MQAFMEQGVNEHIDLIEASQAGNSQAQEELINIYASAVHNLIFSIVGDRNVVEDLAQETFLRMLISINNYKFQAPFRAWLFRIAINLCRDHFRRKKVRAIVSRFFYNPSTEAEQEFIDHSQNPLKELDRKEKAEILRAAIVELPVSLRTVITLRDLQELSYEEIAQTLDWKMGTVKSRLFRARQELAKKLIPRLEELK